MCAVPPTRHGRACPGHPQRRAGLARRGWMPGTSPGMTAGSDMRRDILHRLFQNGHYLFHPLRIALAILIVVSVSGCWEQLAQKHEFFASASGTNAEIAFETERVLAHYAAVQVARRECTKGDPTGVSPSADPSGARALVDTTPRTAPAGEAWADLCGTPKGRYAVHGARLNGYRRWVEDKVRELPQPSDTASSIGGGS